MSNIAKIDFTMLDISGKNYLTWVLDAEIHLHANNLGDTINEGNEASQQDRAKAMVFLRRHLHEGLKTEYLGVKDPAVLWRNLKERYDWIHLHLQDFKSVNEYNSTMFKTVSQLILRGDKVTNEDMLEKTFITFHTSNMLLQQYREMGFKKYSQLISCFLIAEQNNELLMKNHQSHSTGSKPLPEANASENTHTSLPKANASRYWRGHGRGCGRGRGRGGGRNHDNFRNRVSHSNKRNISHHQQWNNNNDDGKRKGKVVYNNSQKKNDDACYKCGVKGHWSHTCRTPRHLVNLYLELIKGNGKEKETNYTDFDNLFYDVNELANITHFEISNFFTGTSGNTNEENTNDDDGNDMNVD